MLWKRSPDRKEQLELAKESVRKWLSDINTLLSKLAASAEGFQKQTTRVYEDVARYGIPRTPAARDRVSGYIDGLRREEAVYYVLVNARDTLVTPAQQALRLEEDALALGRPSPTPDIMGATKLPDVHSWLDDLRRRIDECIARDDFSDLARWGKQHGLTIDLANSRFVHDREFWFDQLAEQWQRRHPTEKPAPAPPKPTPLAPRDTPPRIFIVHGHDEHALAKLESLVLRLRCTPVTFSRIPGKSAKTNIELLEGAIPTCDAVVALLTPDDEGRQRNTQELRLRARQNVLIEAGYAVISRRAFAVIIALGGVEIPSDFDGINRVHASTWSAATDLEVARRISDMFSLNVDINAL